MSDSKDFDPNGMLDAMIRFHEIMSSAMKAGFNREEAFELVRTMVQAYTEGAQRGSE